MATAYAPSNITLSKYWGKSDNAINLPLNSSLSLSLGHLGTTTTVSPADQDTLVFNGKFFDVHEPFAKRVFNFIDYFRANRTLPLKVESSNSIPTATGLASSASGFAALTLALDKAFHLQLPESTLSIIARIGSGSAARSLWHGFARWNRGKCADGMDSYAHHLPIEWPALRIAIITVDTKQKSHSSRDGMNHTMATSPLFINWPAQAERDCDTIEKALRNRDFVTMGETAEANALGMHATMLAARPTLQYLKSQSWSVLETLWKARSEGLVAYATMDAGANIKILYLENAEPSIKELFPSANCIAPFSHLTANFQPEQ